MNSQRHVLLAEDDENDVFFLTRSFREAGIACPLHVARDGQEAIEYLSGEGKYSDRAQYPIPALLILDLKMPRKTGMDVLAWLRQQPFIKALPVMILSSSANRFDVERAYQLWTNSFITKPSSIEKRGDLAKLIKEFWLTLNLLPVVCTEGVEAAKRFCNEPNFPRPML